jgi:hypothetical protein
MEKQETKEDCQNARRRGKHTKTGSDGVWLTRLNSIPGRPPLDSGDHHRSKVNLSDVFRQLHAGDSALVKFVLESGKRRPVGSPVAISLAGKNRCGLEIVLNHLRSARGHHAAKCGCELYTMPPNQRHSHQPRAAAIWQEPGDKLIVQPTNPDDETSIFVKGANHLSLDLPLDNIRFLHILRTALDLDK